jgi:pyruvate/2-oxoglutarate dehydrogenase complex dihydrolipoamide dehydrogenase (E3) component
MAELIFRDQRVVENEAGITQDQFKRNGVDENRGTGKFSDAHHRLGALLLSGVNQDEPRQLRG